MVPYNKDREPSIWQWAGSSLQASIFLDQQGNVTFTNLDEISGRVVLKCAKAVNITSIVVKLEGESRTRLLGQRTPGSYDKDDLKPQLEYHKILYEVLNVFPPANVTDARNNGRGIFTLPSGTHEYPWKFKIPFNNACYASQPSLPGLQLNRSSLGIEVVKEPSRHVKQTLPPTLTGFPGEAEISYFVKATVARQGLLKENPRAFTPFNFLPIEPPRPQPTGSQVFARQRHEFVSTAGIPKKSKMKSFFSGFTDTPDSAGAAPSLSIDIRLPDPAILTCNAQLPLSIVVKKVNAAIGVVYLQSLQVALLGYTKVHAHELERTEQHSWVIVSRSNMQMPLGSASDPAGTEIIVDSNLWQASPLPSTIPPSFVTCNVSRHYQLDVRIGLSYGGNTVGARPQTMILPFRLDAQLYSGIAPPAAVLARMAKANGHRPATQTPVAVPASEDKTDFGSTADEKPSLQQGILNVPDVPPRPGSASYADAPPSYEDVIAADLPPVDGYRPAYSPPAAAQDSLLYPDEKRR